MNKVTEAKLTKLKDQFKKDFMNWSVFKEKYGADCGISLLLTISGTAAHLRQKVEESHYQLKKLDKECSDMKYFLFKPE